MAESQDISRSGRDIIEFSIYIISILDKEKSDASIDFRTPLNEIFREMDHEDLEILISRLPNKLQKKCLKFSDKNNFSSIQKILWRNIELSRNKKISIFAKTLANNLYLGEHIRSLDIHHESIVNYNTFIKAVLKNCPKLRKFVSREEWGLARETLKLVPNLEILQLSMQRIRFCELTDALPLLCMDLQKLKVMPLCSGNIMDECKPECIARFFRAFPRLKSVDFLHVHAFADPVLKSLNDIKTLLSLKLDSIISLNDDLKEKVFQYPWKLEKFYFNYNLKSKDFNSFILKQDSLRKIVIQISDISDGQLAQIGSACRLLEKISISFAKCLTDGGVISLFRRCRFLKSIRLRFIRKITDSSLRAIAKYIPNLRYLELETISVTNKGIHVLGLRGMNFMEVMCHCKNLNLPRKLVAEAYKWMLDMGMGFMDDEFPKGYPLVLEAHKIPKDVIKKLEASPQL